MNPWSATSTAGLDVHEADASHEPPFRRIVCGIDGSRAAQEAAHQAAALSAPGTAIELIAVADEWGVGLNAGASLTRAHAQRVLDETARDLRKLGCKVSTRVASGHPPFEVLLREAEGADLLAVGRHSYSRFGGVAIGRTATNLVHRATLPLLVATPMRDSEPFPARILVAADGPGHPERAVRLAGMIARQCGSEITLVRVNWSRNSRRPELAHAIADLNSLGVEPVEVLMAGPARRRIPQVAAQEGVSLVIVGSRGLGGPHALGSVSERVAHESPCSVLIVRPPVLC